MHFRNKFNFNCINFKFSLDVSHRQSFIFWSSIRGTHCIQTLVSRQQNSRKIIFTGPVLLPTVSAIRWTLTRRFCRTTVSTAGQFSSQTASDGRLDRGSPSKLFLPRQNSAAQRFTMAYDGASSLYTTVIQLCICCCETFSSVKNSITAR